MHKQKAKRNKNNKKERNEKCKKKTFYSNPCTKELCA